ncbi:MnmC family methyltransferase [Gloeomargaritales cyanobacterium VI4D9]|nr:MnmC family methyltransferase [Gloeomargaritales cyanobacterium VI4D9]
MNWKPAGLIYQARFATVITDDGSPTIRDLGIANQECMHHSGGAYQETQYIYGEAIRAVIKTCPNPHFLVVGLGLGYIEILIACEWLKSQPSGHCQVISFESEAYWQEQFQHWLLDEPSELWEIHQLRDDKFKQDYPEEITQAQDWLKNHLILENELTYLPQWQGQIHGILFDAYSSKTSQELWQEDYLIKFLQHYSAEHCLFVTYASTGSLKRALKFCDFMIHERGGFQGKKESTWATKNL